MINILPTKSLNINRCFFREKDENGVLISYHDAVTGKLRLVPRGDIASAIRSDYEQMTESDLIYSEKPTYDALLAKLADIERRANER